MNRKTPLLAALAAATLSGCVSFPPYVPPAAGEPSAIIDTSRVNASLLCSNGTLYSVKAPKDNKLTVPADRRIAVYSALTLVDYNVTYSCSPGLSFKPVSGVSYLLNLEVENQVCRIEVYREGAKNRTGLDLEWTVRGPQDCQPVTVSAETQKQSEALLASAGEKPNAVVLPSGVRYVVLDPGTGRMPAAGAALELEMRGTSAAGYEFINTFYDNKPWKVPVAKLPLEGLRQAVALMPIGARWEVYLPAELAWGNDAKSPVGVDQAVRFTIQLKSAE